MKFKVTERPNEEALNCLSSSWSNKMGANTVQIQTVKLIQDLVAQKYVFEIEHKIHNFFKINFTITFIMKSNCSFI